MEVPKQLVSRCLNRRNLRAGEAAGQKADVAMTDLQQLVEPDLVLQNQHFFTNALEIFCVLDRSGHILRCNAALTLVMGYQPEEVLDHHFADFLELPEQRAKAVEQFSQLPSGQDVVTCLLRCRHRDGSSRWLECSCPALAEASQRIYAICRDVTREKDVQDQLRESHSRYAAALGIVGSVVYEWNTATDQVVWAGNYASMLGYVADDLPDLRAQWLELIHPDDRHDAERAAARILAERAAAHLQYRVRQKGGTYIEVRDDAQFFLDGAGRQEKMIGFITDISAIRQSEARFRAAIRDSPIGILILDAAGMIRFHNTQVENLFGYAADELRGQNVDILVPARYRARHQQLRQQFCQNPAPRMLGGGRNLIGLQKGGAEIPVEIGLGLMPTSEGMMITCMIVDRREYEAARLAVSQSEKQLGDILDHTPSVIYIKDTAGQYLLVNRRFEDLFGISRDAVKGRTDYDLFPHEMAAALRRNDRLVAQSAKALQIEEQVPHEDGIHVYLSEKFPLQDVAGETYAIAGISTDITDRLVLERAEHELATARTVQQLLYPKSSPRIHGYEVAGAAWPATQLCGDYLDFITIGDHQCLVALGDICGHGLGPALRMVAVRAYLRAIVEVEGPKLPLAQAAQQLNKYLLADMDESGFLSMFLILLTEKSNTVHYLGAGHDALVLRSHNTLEHLKSNGCVLGITDQLTFQSQQPLSLTVGDVLVAVTDGVIETMNASRELFGRERLSHVVRQQRERRADEIVAAIHDSVTAFADGRPQSDDMTVAVVKAL